MAGRISSKLGIVLAALLLASAVSTATLAEESGLPFSEELAELGDQIFDDEDLSIHRNQG